jgi:hypothetical protein
MTRRPRRAQRRHRPCAGFLPSFDESTNQDQGRGTHDRLCVPPGTHMTLDPYAVASRPDARARITRPRARRTSHGTHPDAIARDYLCVIAHENGRDARIIQGLGERHGEARERQRRGCGVVLRASARGDGVVRDGDARECSCVCVCARGKAFWWRSDQFSKRASTDEIVSRVLSCRYCFDFKEKEKLSHRY